MADNETTGTGKAVATDKVTYSGDADQNVQLIRPVGVTGSEGSKTVVDIPTDATAGLKVNPHHNGTEGTATWTSATPDETTLSVPTAGAPSAFLLIVGDGGGATDGTFEFEMSFDGGTTWMSMRGINLSTSAIQSSALAVNADGVTTAWTFPALGATHVRVRLSIVIQGSESFSLRLVPTTAVFSQLLRTDTTGSPQITILGTPTVTAQQSVASNLRARIDGPTAHDGGGSSTNPLLIGGYAEDTPPPVVGSGDAVRARFNTTGMQVVGGGAAEGALALTGQNFPLVVAGKDGSGNVDALETDGAGALKTAPVDAVADNTGFVDGTTKLGMAGYILDETPGTGLTENDAAAARVDSKRAQVLVLEDATTRGQRAAVDASGRMSAVVTGDVAADATDAGNPIKLGAVATSHGSTPASVDAGDRVNLIANRHGVLFQIGGHPNVSTRSARFTASQTDAAIIPSIASGSRAIVTQLQVTCSAANTVNVGCKIGFGTSTIPADSTSGATGVILDHDGIAPGSGMVVGNGGGIIGIGGDDEELRITCDAPTSGSIIVTYSFFTILS